ncbi:MAG: hypothetical protein AAGG38_13520 [Planctomycetota bacterium]
MSQPSTLAASVPASVTRNVTRPIQAGHDHSRSIGDLSPLPPKVAHALAFEGSGFYDLDEVVEASLDPLALALGLDRHPVRDWQAGDTARLDTPGGRYVVEVVRVHRSPETAVDAASVRVRRVLDADSVSGHVVGAEGMWPLTALRVADAA